MLPLNSSLFDFCEYLAKLYTCFILLQISFRDSATVNLAMQDRGVTDAH